jgi:hypothetical protein
VTLSSTRLRYLCLPNHACLPGFAGESAVPNNPGSDSVTADASSLSLAEWERGFNAKFKGLASVEFATARLQYLYDRYRYARCTLLWPWDVHMSLKRQLTLTISAADQKDNSNEAQEADEDQDEDDCIGAAGIELMGHDLDISPDDVRLRAVCAARLSCLIAPNPPSSGWSCVLQPRGMALTWRLAAKTMSKFTRDEFISGLQALQYVYLSVHGLYKTALLMYVGPLLSHHHQGGFLSQAASALRTTTLSRPEEQGYVARDLELLLHLRQGRRAQQSHRYAPPSSPPATSSPCAPLCAGSATVQHVY